MLSGYCGIDNLKLLIIFQSVMLNSNEAKLFSFKNLPINKYAITINTFYESMKTVAVQQIEKRFD